MTENSFILSTLIRYELPVGDYFIMFLCVYMYVCVHVSTREYSCLQNLEGIESLEVGVSDGYEPLNKASLQELEEPLTTE